ncbi:TrkH family potassium uptake protein [Thomasclavelia cocleata]|uniref:TrkH family potassium uptake protein n=1 Tax=Thomasclavelia cocleata TaxID=69824 RepID=UPI002574FA3F|nr:TrkH family potassium uptake protein [Thomasclavelia cocleata]
MNRKMIIYTLGKLLCITGLLMYIPVLVALIYQETEGIAFAIVGAILFVLGISVSYNQPVKKNIYAREGFVIVALSWILISVFGALPFYITGEISSFIDAFFEMVSGFTTTGSSILNDIEALSHASLFWRSFSHWLGGMGILVFVIAFIPISSGRSLHILKAEVPGPVVGKLVSKIRLTARILYIIYAILTLVETFLLLFGGMPLFDSLLNSFGTAGTGGFAIKNASIAAYDSVYVDTVITVFMILFGINFNLIYFIIIGKIKEVFKSEELRYYFLIILGAVFLITINILPMYDSILSAIRYSSFTVGSIITTTGFVIADYTKWPMFSQMIIIALMFVGACSGSTGGGMKVSRIVIYLKNAKKELKHLLHPHSIQTVEFEKNSIDDHVIVNIHAYLALYLAIFAVSLLILTFFSLDFESAFSAVATCLNNVGPGLGVVGPVNNFSSLSDISKFVLSFDMLAGRLEIFPILLLFAPSQWRK